MAKSKDTEIKKYEKAQKSSIEELSTVYNIFVYDSKINVNEFKKSRNPGLPISGLQRQKVFI